tara:strand:- start:631 stop:1494 length:864 start_codon:yes stop_codon:yes gene_type:complete
MRIKHWSKNLFIFLPLFFGGEINNLELLSSAFIIFIAFNFTASAVYIVNDWQDIAKDRLHPTKKNRPLAAGTIKPFPALIFAALLTLLAFVIAIFIVDELWATLILAYYLVQNLLYSFWMKHFAIVDVSVIAIGFVLRIFIGGVVTGIELSQWIISLTLLLAIFLAFAKRRDDVIVYEKTEMKLRKSLDGYNRQFLDTAMAISATLVIMAYFMFAISPETTARLGKYFYLTTFFVFVGILQYLKLTQVHTNSANPVDMLISNLFLQLIILGWVASFVVLLYFKELTV